MSMFLRTSAAISLLAGVVACGGEGVADRTVEGEYRLSRTTQGLRQERVEVCHYDDDGVSHIIEVADPALDAHTAHGDHAVEPVDVCGDGIDNDCDGEIDEDGVEFFVNSSSFVYVVSVCGSEVSLTEVGPSGATLTDVAESPDGTLYGISFNTLYEVDPTTGAASSIGALGATMNGLAVDNIGQLYGSGGNFLYTIDSVTGAGTAIGAFGPGISSSGDVVFCDGDLFLSDAEPVSDRLVLVDPATGAGTVIGEMGFSSVFGLSCGADGVLRGLTAQGLLIEIDSTTGAGTLVDDLGPSFWGSGS